MHSAQKKASRGWHYSVSACSVPTAEELAWAMMMKAAADWLNSRMYEYLRTAKYDGTNQLMIHVMYYVHTTEGGN